MLVIWLCLQKLYMLCSVQSWKNINSLSKHVIYVWVCMRAHVCISHRESAFLANPDPWFSILDINECVSGKAVCPYNRRCVNTFGSYYCKCHVGFELKYISGRYDCVGKIWWHFFLFPSPSPLVEQSTVTTQKRWHFFMFLAFKELWWHELYEARSVKI